uniref:Transmembrane protein 268 n=1 Tax=Timema genevievae TaxID=629358 RepID=A0A7R9K3J9_TIMGE|nr:unnamed protein product [Timema genevievae]
MAHEESSKGRDGSAEEIWRFEWLKGRNPSAVLCTDLEARPRGRPGEIPINQEIYKKQKRYSLRTPPPTSTTQRVGTHPETGELTVVLLWLGELVQTQPEPVSQITDSGTAFEYATIMNSKPQTASSAPVAGEPAPGWVRFEEEGGRAPSNMESPSTQAPDGQEEYNGAVIKPETVHVNLNRSMSHSVSLEQSSTPPSTVFRGVPGDSPEVTTSTTSGKQPAMRSVNLNDVVNGRSTNTGRVSTHGGAVVRQGFANGDIIVTLLPVNTKFPWVTPAQFRPELVPEELMAQGLTLANALVVLSSTAEDGEIELTVEDYVHVMEVLTNDVRFNVYNVCYKRILVAWIFTAFVVLLGLLFSGVTGLTLFGLGVMWLVLNAAAIFLCMWVKIKLNQNLERCMAQVNKHLLRHSIILGLDDRGKLSCHKVNLCFIYFDTMDCIKKLQEVIDREEREGRPVNREETAEERRQRQAFQERMDIEDRDIIIQGSNTTRLSRKQVSSVPSLWTETSSYRRATPPDCLRNRDIIQGSTTTRLSRKQMSSAPSLWTETSSYRGPTPPDCLGNK